MAAAAVAAPGIVKALLRNVGATPADVPAGELRVVATPFAAKTAKTDDAAVNEARAPKYVPKYLSMYEYDGETQGAIRKILFDQDQKRKGQPTSDEMQNEELLRRAWDAEGSPFRGTPYDPSKVSLSQGGSET